MRADVTRVVIHGPADALDRLALIAGDLKAAGRVQELVLQPGGDTLNVAVELAPITD